MLPLLIAEQLVHPYTFYLNERLQQGMRYGQGLYGLLAEFPPEARLTAYQRSCELSEQGLKVMMTASSFRYALWIDLRTASQLGTENLTVGTELMGSGNSG